MKYILLALALLWAAPAVACPVETEEARITELLTADDSYFIIKGEDLDLFIKQANDLYNIGWIRATIDHVYVIDAEYKADNPNFQVVHVFFIAPEGCIVYYQTAYKVVVKMLLDPQVYEKLGIER